MNKSKSSSEKSTGLSRELCRLGDKASEICRHESAEKKFKSGSETASCGSVNEWSVADARPSAIVAGLSAVGVGNGGERTAVSEAASCPLALFSSGVGCLLSMLFV